MIILTHTGDYGILWILLTVLLIVLPKTRDLGRIIGISIGIEFLICNVILKNLIARTRPYDVIEELEMLIGRQPDYSFPSGHAGCAFAFVLLFGLPKFSDSTKYKVVTVIALIYASVISFSRLYVGVHYPTDVAAGALIGLLSGLAAYFIDKKLLVRFRKLHIA